MCVYVRTHGLMRCDQWAQALLAVRVHACGWLCAFVLYLLYVCMRDTHMYVRVCVYDTFIFLYMYIRMCVCVCIVMSVSCLQALEQIRMCVRAHTFFELFEAYFST